MPEFSFNEPNEENALRHDDYEQWMRTIRDPADAASEGVRILQSKDGRSYASYEIALLPDGRWAIKFECRLRANSGIGIPWTLFDSRAECLKYFQKNAANQFGSEQTIPYGLKMKQQAHHEMVDLLSDGLFGFIEPDVDHQKQSFFNPSSETNPESDGQSTASQARSSSMTENTSEQPGKESDSLNQQAEQQQEQQKFRITQSLYQYRRYLVTALTYEEAMQKLLAAAPVDSEVSFFTETDDVKPVPNDVARNEVFFNDIVSVDSEDQSEIYYERE